MERSKETPKAELASLECSNCGARAEAASNCGVAYVPARERAAKALAANPEKSDRGIAKEIGVSHQTVKRERAKLGVTDVTPEKRLGRDGKRYAAKRKDPGRHALGSHVERAVEVAAEPPKATLPAAEITAAYPLPALSPFEIAPAYAARAAELAKEKPSAAAAGEDLSQLLIEDGRPLLQEDIEWLTYFSNRPRSVRVRLLAVLNEACHPNGTWKAAAFSS